jgi:hypothetical protein
MAIFKSYINLPEGLWQYMVGFTIRNGELIIKKCSSIRDMVIMLIIDTAMRLLQFLDFSKCFFLFAWSMVLIAHSVVS